MNAEEIDVLIVAGRDDPHAQAVADSLDQLGSAWLRLCYSDLPGAHLTWSPAASLTVTQGGTHRCVSKATTVWWRRSGSLDTGELGALEAKLCDDEIHAIVPAALDTVGVRWVDAPANQWSAGEKLRQLATVHQLGIRYPETLVTSSPTDARDWALARVTPVVAKAASSGFGIAPFVETVPADELARVQHCPTMLQELVDATADLRVVTIGDHAFGWRRPRRDRVGLIDWRQADPTGSAFEHIARPSIEDPALSIATALGLTFSVQDWLETGDADVFLEVNPQGQWLFLEQAETVVAPALAAHLASESVRRTR